MKISDISFSRAEGARLIEAKHVRWEARVLAGIREVGESLADNGWEVTEKPGGIRAAKGRIAVLLLIGNGVVIARVWVDGHQAIQPVTSSNVGFWNRDITGTAAMTFTHSVNAGTFFAAVADRAGVDVGSLWVLKPMASYPEDRAVSFNYRHQFRYDDPDEVDRAAAWVVKQLRSEDEGTLA